MKRTHSVLLAILFIVAVFGMMSCEDDDDSVSISERIDLFESDLNNGDYSSLYLNFHPDMASYESYKSESTVNTGVISSAYATFTFGAPSVSGTIATGSFTNSTLSGTYSATMKEDGSDNWKILKITINDGTTDLTFKGISLGSL